MNWLPTTLDEVKRRGWKNLDVIIFSGDAYVDHPAFAAAIIGRTLEYLGLRVAIVPQPNWRDDLRDFKKLGVPNLFFAVTAGNMDSMVNHYTANKRLRSDDAYTPGNKAGFRPDYATYVYTRILKNLFPNVPVVIGGIEASLRRLTHYDYWQDCLKPSILLETNADLLIYGLGEFVLPILIEKLKKGFQINQITDLPQSGFISNKKPDSSNFIMLNSFEECLKDKIKFVENFEIIEKTSNSKNPKTLVEPVGNKYVIINPPISQLYQHQIDLPYSFPYTRLPHPRYQKRGKIPAYDMIKFSINTHRGCFGGCSFCTIAAHQGRFILSRSKESIMNELEKIVSMPDFKGYITDLGGPSANMYNLKPQNIDICQKCQRLSCIYPNICKNLDTDHSKMLELYSEVSRHPKVKKVSIGSGIRYDLFYNENGNMNPDKYEYAKELIKKHVSGRLKVAPEHTEDRVLKIMRKPSFDYFKKFKEFFEKINNQYNLNQQIVPYFISSHPGCTLEDMAQLAIETKKLNFKLEQIQDFTPTPMTAASVMYYAEIEPFTRKKIYVAKTQSDKKDQRMFFFWYNDQYKVAIKAKLLKLHRADLIQKLLK